jgi:hypothetical protein
MIEESHSHFPETAACEFLEEIGSIGVTLLYRNH